VVLSAIGPTRPEARAVEALLDDRCEAVILLGPRSTTRSLTALAAKLPVITLARIVRSAAVDTVSTDDHAGMDAALGHLVHLGHRRIAYLDGQRTPGAPERLHALNSAAARSLPEDRVRVVPAGPGEEDGVGAIELLMATGPLPTAVIAFNDRCAIGAIGALNRAGLKVPRDISLVGYDDSRLARISYIDLTTVGQNPFQLAELAVHRAIDRLDNRPIDRRDQVVTPRFVIRSSTAPPRD
jgi:LacI family transcriptional regulator